MLPPWCRRGAQLQVMWKCLKRCLPNCVFESLEAEDRVSNIFPNRAATTKKGEEERLKIGGTYGRYF